MAQAKAVLAASVAAWAFLAWIAVDMGHPLVQLTMPGAPDWSVLNVLAVFVMWTVMMAAMMLPSALLRLFLPSTDGTSSLVSLLLFAVSMVLTWRMTNATIGKGAAVGTAVFVGMFVASLLVLFGLQALLGIDMPDATKG